jgi:AcrR family transcriptional regulator
MNTENNRRYQETEEKILDTYAKLAGKKSIDKITVSDICKEAGIHRTTFYGHYQDLPALQEKIELQQLQYFLDQFQQNENWDTRQGLMQQLRFYYDHRNIIRKHLRYEDIPNINSAFFSRQVLDAYDAQYREHFQCEDDIEMEYHQVFFQAGLTALIAYWLSRDCQEPPEKLTSLLLKIYEN